MGTINTSTQSEVHMKRLKVSTGVPTEVTTLCYGRWIDVFAVDIEVENDFG